VSLILDALRRKSTPPDGTESADRPRRADTVLASLGYPRSPGGRARPSLKTLVLYGVAAVALGFAGLSLVIFLLAPSAAPKPGAVVPARTVAQRAATPPETKKTSPLPPPSIATPRQASPAPAAPHVAQRSATPEPVPPPVVQRPATPAPPPLFERRPATQSPRTASSAPSRRSSPSRVAQPAPPAVVATAPAPPPATAPPPVNHFGRALYFQGVGDFDNALAQYRALLEQNDANAEVHNNLGLLYQERNQLDDAIKQFQRAIAIDPRSVKAHNNLGVAYMRSSRPDVAAAEFRFALASDPHNVESLVNLALVQRSGGRIADARALLRRALTINPRSAGSHYNLAVVADETGDTAAAIEHYRAFLRFGAVTHPELIAAVRARLTTLGG
jgi:Tfp pilus assembly protein PilF